MSGEQFPSRNNLRYRISGKHAVFFLRHSPTLCVFWNCTKDGRQTPCKPAKLSEPLAPRMLRWSSLGMRLQEMVQDMQQGHHMLLVASDELGLPNIVNDHVQNFFTAVFLGQEVRSKCCCSDFG